MTLKDVCAALAKVKTKWFIIGVQLGIPRHKLQEFKYDLDPLSAVVYYWLRGNVTESDDPISWQTIVAVLKCDYIEESKLAEIINAKYCQKEGSLSFLLTSG